MRNYWNESIERLISGVISEGYSAKDLLATFTSHLYDIVGGELERQFKEVDEEAEHETEHETEHEIKYSRKGIKHKSRHDRKVLSDRFEGCMVYIKGVKDSMAYIDKGDDLKSPDVFTLMRGGETLNCDEYMNRFLDCTTDLDSSYRNTYKIVFLDNPDLSVGTLKRSYWDSIFTLDDIIHFVPYGRGKGRKE